jgi:hypothetical protein
MVHRELENADGGVVEAEKAKGVGVPNRIENLTHAHGLDSANHTGLQQSRTARSVERISSSYSQSGIPLKTVEEPSVVTARGLNGKGAAGVTSSTTFRSLPSA